MFTLTKWYFDVVSSGGAILAAAVFGVLAYVAYGVDFPQLGARFSRLV